VTHSHWALVSLAPLCVSRQQLPTKHSSTAWLLNRSSWLLNAWQVQLSVSSHAQCRAPNDSPPDELAHATEANATTAQQSRNQ